MSVRILMVLLAAVVLPLLPVSAMQVAPAEKFECARPIPRSIVKKVVFPKNRFVLQKVDKSGQTIFTGIETVQFNNGDRLTIKNDGCEFITLRFRFETSRMDARRISDSTYLYRRSAWLMRQTLRGLNSPFNLAKGIAALEKYAAQKSVLELDRNIKYGGAEFQSVVNLVKAEKLPNGKTSMEMLFYYGPI
jgi:hypothetical protein